jgi:hypothetical protein
MIATVIAFFALIISAVTVWLTLFRKGTLRMTRAIVIFFDVYAALVNSRPIKEPLA